MGGGGGVGEYMYSLRHLVACNCSKIYFCFCFDLGVIKKFFLLFAAKQYRRLSSTTHLVYYNAGTVVFLIILSLSLC